MWLNRSLKYGVFIIPYWPMKMYWATRKVCKMAVLRDFPSVPEGHVDANIRRSLVSGGKRLEAKH